MTKLGYWVDLQSFKLGDKEQSAWLHAFPYGSWQHPLHGTITMDPRRATRMASNVKLNVRGQELDIDYDHKEREGKAAGWVKDAEVRDNGLWLLIEFTEPAAVAVRNKEYRYFSPEYVDKWRSPAGTVHQDVLFGGALTNRPFLKDILPINMSELDGGEQVDEFLKKLRDKLGLPEDATEDQIMAAFEVVEDPPEDKPETEEEESEEEEEETEEVPPEQAELIAAMEKSPMVRKLMEAITEQGKTIQELIKTNKEEGARKRLNEMIQGTGSYKFALPPAVEEDMVKALTEGSATSFSAAMEKLLETGLVELGERGGRRPADGKTATQIWDEKMIKLTEGDKGMNVADASVKLAEEEPDLYEAYRREAFTTEEV